MISIIHFIKHNTNLFPSPKDLKENNYSYYKNDKHICGALTNGIFDIIEAFSMHHLKYESVRLLLLEIYVISQPENNNILDAIQKRLNILLTEKIEENLIAQYYPAVTASLIYSFGLCEPEKSTLLIHEILLKKLKENFIKAFKSKPSVALDMLPQDTTYDELNKRLIRKHAISWKRERKVQVLELE